MKKSILLVAAILYGLLLFPQLIVAQNIVQTTDVTVIYKNQPLPSDFENVTKFYFYNGNLMLDQSGVTTAIPLETIKRLELDAVSNFISVADWGESTILIYPNPTSDKLYFSSPSEQNVLVAIYSLNGQLLKREQVSTSENLDVSSLSKGIYIIKVNDQIYKFSKL